MESGLADLTSDGFESVGRKVFLKGQVGCWRADDAMRMPAPDIRFAGGRYGKQAAGQKRRKSY